MTDERDQTSEPGHEPENNVDNKLDSLLPVPDDSTEHKHDQVDGPIDELLPIPGEPDMSTDDASTREELEVDTTADGIDDFIPLNDPDDAGKSNDPEPPPTSDAKKDDPADTSECPICGSEVGQSRFCPECGTEQVPTSRAMARIAPIFMWSRPLAIRVTLSIGALLALLALLGDSGAIALIITASTLPVVLLIRLADQLGGKSRDSWVQISMMALVGVAAGLPIAWLATRMVRRSWFDGGVISFGATNFGGIAVETAGSAPFLVWLTSGILLPLVVLLAIAAAPAALRMALSLPPRESTGMILTAGAAAGYVVGSSAVFYWPMFTEMAPVMSTSQWTLTILGVAVIRPLVWVYSGAMLGAVVWRYLRNASLPGIAVPASIAIGLPLIFSIVSLVVASTGLWISTVIGLIFSAAAVYLHARFLNTAFSNDKSLARATAPESP